jgi:hypothetical protein
MRGSVRTQALVLAAFFGWSLLISIREWLGISAATAPPSREHCPSVHPATIVATNEVQVNVRVPPGARAWLN